MTWQLYAVQDRLEALQVAERVIEVKEQEGDEEAGPAAGVVGPSGEPLTHSSPRKPKPLDTSIKTALEWCREYIRVNNPSLNRNIGKYHLPHIWDKVLFNIPELKLK